MRSSSLNKDGFTLIEVLIAIVILAFISLGLYNAITETYKIRETLSTEGDFYSGIRLSIAVLQRDLTLVYSPLSLVPPSPSPAASGAVPPPQQAPVGAATPPDPELLQSFDYWEPALDKTGVRPSRFTGSDSKITFVANSHFRVYKDTPESEFSTIAYEVTRDDANPNTQMLVKTENTDAFTLERRERSPFERRYSLLHGITKFKYRFYRKDKDEWVDAWDTDKDQFKGLYPDIIELTIEVKSGPKLSFSGRFLFRPELPLRAINPSM